MSEQSDLLIVGSGLAGTTTLVHELLKIAGDPRITADSPVKIMMVERYPQQQYGGVAYGKTSDFKDHHLNLTAKSPTTFALDSIPPDFPQFSDYILDMANRAGADPGLGPQQRGEQKERILNYLQNPPRELFGEYLSHLVDLAKERAGGKAEVTMRTAEALDVDVSGTHPRLKVRDEDGQIGTLETKHLVLATGQREPLRPAFVDGVVGSPHYLEDNYSAAANEFYNNILAGQAQKEAAGKEKEPDNVLIIGTGLSAMDSALRLIQSGYEGKITMISRNGLEHAGYGSTSTEEYLANSLTGEPRPERVAELERRLPRFMGIVSSAKEKGDNYPGSVEANLIQSMQREFALHMKKGYTSEEVLGYWERFIPDMAEVLSDDACNRMYGQYATWMTTHRVGTTPENASIIEKAQKSGQLVIKAGFISSRAGEKMHEVDGKIQVTIIPAQRVARADVAGGDVPRDWEAVAADGPQPVTQTFNHVISGMGYSVDYSRPRDPFWKSLADKGLIMQHQKSGDGIELDTDFTVINAKGKRVEGVTAIGVPAVGATMFGRTPHPEKPGVTGGRMPPFYANIVGISGGVQAMVDGGLHEKLVMAHALGREGGKTTGVQSRSDLPESVRVAADGVSTVLTDKGVVLAQEPATVETSGKTQGWQQAAKESLHELFRKWADAAAQSDNQPPDRRVGTPPPRS